MADKTSSDEDAARRHEEELAFRARTDPQSFASLYDRYYGAILSYLYRLTLDRDVAEELTSRTFFNAVRSIKKYRESVSFRAWLYRIALNELKMFWRSGRNRRKREIDYSIVCQSERLFFDQPEIETREEEELRTLRFLELHKALGMISEKHRTALVLRYWEGLSTEETARVMGKRVGTVKSYVHRGIAELRMIMKPCDATIPEPVHYYR